jgi:hypothetical protein
MTEATGFEAANIHRLLEYGGEGPAALCAQRRTTRCFTIGRRGHEMSMVDLPLLYARCARCPPVRAL